MCINMSKVCTGCKQTKTHCNFGKGKNGKFGLKSKCKECISIENKKWREQNPLYIKQHYEDNKEYYQKHNKKQYENNKDKYNKQSKEYYEQNKEKRKKYNEKPVNKEKQIKRNKKKLQDPVYKLKHYLGMYINEGIKKCKSTKNKHTLEIMGLETWELFREYIENQFTYGMTWNNHGIGKDNTTWHIDHIIPISSAQTEEDVYRLNHYTNLRPMWGSDNIRKSNKWL